MANILQIGLSALLAQQRALTITSNNIANANTPGFSRQRAELAALDTERMGSSFVGRGVGIAGTRRLTDELLLAQVRVASSNFHRSATFAGMSEGIELLLADSQLGLGSSLQNLVNAMQDLADNPSSNAVRQTVLSQARQLASTFASYGARLDEIERQANSRIQATVTEINSLGQGIANLNGQVLALSANGQVPPDLADQRDQMIARLAELVSVKTITQGDGTASVFVGSGQVLVLGSTASRMGAVPSEFAIDELEVALLGSAGNTVITKSLSGGELGGLLDFKREMLDPLRNELGRIAYGLVASVNDIHREGMDLYGNAGGDLFSLAGPSVSDARGNTGTANVSVTIEGPGALQTTGYQLQFDGGSFRLLRTDTGSVVSLSGSGTPADPFRADGLAIVVTGSPAAADAFRIEPLADVAGTMRLLLNDPAELAAAAPTRTRAELDNIGSAAISLGEIVDIDDPDLLTTTTIEFLSPATYSINGAGVFAYASGDDIIVNGSRVRITGSPAAGDRFVIEPNSGGVGDNRNALRLGGVLGPGIFSNGTVSLGESAARLVARVGTQAQEMASQRDVQRALLANSESALDSVRGVNLDEEATLLLEQEQMYQAAAQTIAVADSLFQTLLAALRR